MQTLKTTIVTAGTLVVIAILAVGSPDHSARAATSLPHHPSHVRSYSIK